MDASIPRSGEEAGKGDPPSQFNVKERDCKAQCKAGRGKGKGGNLARKALGQKGDKKKSRQRREGF